MRVPRWAKHQTIEGHRRGTNNGLIKRPSSLSLLGDDFWGQYQHLAYFFYILPKSLSWQSFKLEIWKDLEICI